MERYAARWPSAAPLGDALAGLTQVTGTTPLPQYVARSLVFPYFQGERFVERCAARAAATGGSSTRPSGRGRRARRRRSCSRGVADRERPVAVSVAGLAPPSRGGRWRLLTGSTLGAEDLAALLSADGTARGAAADGRLAGRPLRAVAARTACRGGCAAPCRTRDALLLATADGRPRRRSPPRLAVRAAPGRGARRRPPAPRQRCACGTPRCASRSRRTCRSRGAPAPDAASEVWDRRPAVGGGAYAVVVSRAAAAAASASLGGAGGASVRPPERAVYEAPDLAQDVRASGVPFHSGTTCGWRSYTCSSVRTPASAMRCAVRAASS